MKLLSTLFVSMLAMSLTACNGDDANESPELNATVVEDILVQKEAVIDENKQDDSSENEVADEATETMPEQEPADVTEEVVEEMSDKVDEMSDKVDEMTDKVDEMTDKANDIIEDRVEELKSDMAE